MRRKPGWSALTLIPLLLLGACAQGGGETGGEAKAGAENPPASEPVTLKLYSLGAGINTDTDVNDIFLKPLKDKYPNISIELIKNMNLDQLVASGTIPDLIATSNYYMISPVELGLASDLNDFVKKEKIDLNRFEPEAVKVIRNFGKNGELYGIPFSLNYGMLAYNKDIFDKFAVPYPRDGMTWSQIIELARKVTRGDGGVQYVGLDPGPALSLVRAHSLPLLDAKREKAALTTDGFQKVFSLFKEIYDIPGEISPDNKLNYGINGFLKDKKLAMYPYWISAFATSLSAAGDAAKSFDWDLVTYPTNDNRPGVGREIDFHLLMVPPASKNKEAACDVIKTLVSDEAQKAMNSGARLTILNDLNLRKQFAASMNVFEGKNISGIFKVTPAPLPPSSDYDIKIYGILGDALKSMAVDKQDMNTVLRTANEQADQYIQEQKSK